jgi:tellurite resistance protein TerC
MTPIEYPYWVWIFFFALVLTALFVDIGIVNRRSHAPTRKETIGWSIVWVSLALAFGGFILWQFGLSHAKLFITGYLIEMSLSVDNLFVFLLIFSYFKVPKKYQHRVLFWGIFMALVLRLVMMIYTGIKMFGDDDTFEPEESSIVKLTTRFIRIRKHYDGEKFFVNVDGKRAGTLLLLVLVVINVADIVFAVDSIPAIFGITTDRFIVYTSNIFAILGLRTFFFLLADLADRFHYLKYGLAFVLTFIGVKMLLPLLAEGLVKLTGADDTSAFTQFLDRYNHHEYEQLVINISLGVVVAAIAVSIIASMLIPAHKNEQQVTGD